MEDNVSTTYMTVTAITIVVISIAIGIYFIIQTLKQIKQKEDLSVTIEQLENQLQEAKKQYDLKLISNKKQVIDQLRSCLNTDNTHLLSQALIGESTKQFLSNTQTLIETKFNRTSQELLGNLGDEAENLILELKMDLCERIWDSFQNYKEMVKDTPIIMPDNCKIAYTKGIRTILVIEQKPQVRTVTLNRNLVKYEEIAKNATGVTKTGYRFNLAFPYVYFFMVFDEGKYEFHEVYFRNKMLTSSREHVHLAPIPNVFTNSDHIHNNVCMGKGFASEVASENSIAKKANLVISDFWQRTFNDDLGDGGHQKLDKRISDYDVWQENSKNDPLFVLSVNWPKGKTVKGIVEKLLDSRKQTSKIDAVDKEIRTKLENGVAKLTNKIKDEIKNAKAKELSQFELDQMAKSAIEKSLLSHSELVFKECIKKV